MIRMMKIMRKLKIIIKKMIKKIKNKYNNNN